MSLILLAAFLIPVLVFYLVRGRKLYRVPSLFLFKKVSAGRSPLLRRLASPLALLLHTLFLFCLSLALTSERSIQKDRLHVLILATSEYPGEWLVSLAEPLLQTAKRLEANGRVLVIESGSYPRLLMPDPGNRESFENLLEQVTPHRTITHLEAALELTSHIFTDVSEGDVTLFSDGLLGSSDLEYLSSNTVSRRGQIFLTNGRREIPLYWVAADPPRGPEIVSLDQLEAQVTPAPPRFRFALTNKSPLIRQVRLEIRLDEQLVHHETLQLNAKEFHRGSFQLPQTSGDRMVARLLQAPDGPLLSSYYKTLQAQINVTLVTRGNDYLVSALESNPQLQVRLLRPDAFDPTGADFFIFDRSVPTEIPNKPTLLIAPPPERSPIKVVGRSSDLDLLRAARKHPFLSTAWVDDWHIGESLHLSPVNSQPLLFSGDALIMASRWQNQIPVIVMGWDLQSSNLPHQSSFPLWIADLIKASTQPVSFDSGPTTGLVSFEATSPAETGYSVRGPDGTPLRIWPDQERLHFYAPAEGFYAIDGLGGSHLVPVNRRSGWTQDLRQLGWTPHDPPADTPVLGPTGAELFLYLAILVSLGEFLLYRLGWSQ